MADVARSPAWYAKPFTLTFPAGILAVLITSGVGAALAGGVGMATREGDLSVVDAHIEASANQLRREVQASDDAAEALALARYDEILRRLDRIERRMDQGVK